MDSKVSKLYQVEGMPNTVILDRSGKVRYIHRGYTPGADVAISVIAPIPTA